MTAISVIVPAFNAERFIGQTLASASAQTCRDFEIIVVDDGSTDRTWEAAQSAGPVHLVRQQNLGVSAARNRGAKEARGEFLAFLDADDIWHPEKLKLQLAAMRSHPDAVLSRTVCIGGWGASTLPETLPEPIRVSIVSELAPSFLNPFFGTPTVMVRKDAFDAIGGFDTDLRTGEDVDMYLRVLANAPKVVLVDAPLVFVRNSMGSLSRDDAAGYVRLLFVYERFLETHPEARRALGAEVIGQAMRRLHILRAKALVRSGRTREAMAELTNARSFGAGSDLLHLWLEARLTAPIRRGLKSRLRPNAINRIRAWLSEGA